MKIVAKGRVTKGGTAWLASSINTESIGPVFSPWAPHHSDHDALWSCWIYCGSLMKGSLRCRSSSILALTFISEWLNPPEIASLMRWFFHHCPCEIWGLSMLGKGWCRVLYLAIWQTSCKLGTYVSLNIKKGKKTESHGVPSLSSSRFLLLLPSCFLFKQ